MGKEAHDLADYLPKEDDNAYCSKTKICHRYWQLNISGKEC